MGKGEGDREASDGTGMKRHTGKEDRDGPRREGRGRG